MSTADRQGRHAATATGGKCACKHGQWQGRRTACSKRALARSRPSAAAPSSGPCLDLTVATITSLRKLQRGREKCRVPLIS